MRNKFKMRDRSESRYTQVLQKLDETFEVSSMPNRVGQIAVSTEGYDTNELEIARNAYNGLEHSLTTALESLGIDAESDNRLMPSIEAATLAGMVASNYKENYNRAVVLPKAGVESDGRTVTMPVIHQDIEARPSLEAFDEQEVRELTHYHTVFNLGASQQDEFGEAFYKTVTANPDEVGLSISVDIPILHNDSIRSINGDETDFNRKNLLRAFADHTILHDESTRLVPVVRPSSEKYFVDKAVVPTQTIKHDGGDVVTAPLKPGVSFDILALSQPDTMIARGVNDHTDSVHPAVYLDSIIVKAGADILELRTNGLLGSAFTGGFQGVNRVTSLAMDSKAITVQPGKTQRNGDPLVTLADVDSKSLTVKLRVSMTGSVNTTTGATEVFVNRCELATVFKEDGTELASSDADYQALETALADAAVIGYNLKAFRSNVNKRQIGRLVDTITYSQVWPVALRSPISAVRPVQSDQKRDAVDLNTLITVTKIETANSAVSALIEYNELLKDHVAAGNTSTDPSEMLGLGSLLVRPTHYYNRVDMDTAVDSQVSHQRLADIRETLANQIRHAAYTMFTNSEYRAAYQLLYGNISGTKITINVGTSPIVAQYLNGMDGMTEGDLNFRINVVTTDDRRMSENGVHKVYIGFSSNKGRPGQPDVLSTGCMAWFPELTGITSVSRNNRVTRDLTVAPRYLHINTLPVLGELDIANFESVLKKVTRYETTV